MHIFAQKIRQNEEIIDVLPFFCWIYLLREVR